ncbi:MAG: xanthine dehydrogenase family protein molybdopterin-binding subunit [Alphaproteobacteria bacterium]|nr:xanthine dehydrogenase family protein molybdopterin-binding subunit [Alphaproteobacteria bacterium]
MNRIINTLIGTPIERREDERFLRGRGTFVADLKRVDALHAVILRSTVAHGRIMEIDAERALALRGVRAVLTAADLGTTVPKIPIRLGAQESLRGYQQPVIADGKVRYVGEPVAVIVADSAAIAEDALDLVEIYIEALTPIVDREQALESQALLFEESGTNLPDTLSAIKGDADAAFEDAYYTRRETFQVQRHSGMPMESRGLLAQWDAGAETMTVFGAAKVPFHNKGILAKLMELPDESVILVENDVGGGFGVRGEFYPEDFLIPFAARHLGRPVKWQEDRREHMLATNHAREAECDLEIACDRDGRVLGLRGRAWVNTGAYIRTSGPVPPRNIAQVISGPYRIENIDLDVSIIVANKTPSGTYRGPGRFEADFFRERMLDLAAEDLGIDRVDFRRRNLVRDEDMPWPLATVMPMNMAGECDSGDYAMTLERCLKEFDWAEKAKRAGQLIDGRYHGIALGCYIEGTSSGEEHARLVLEDDGTVSVFVGSSSVGQGIETIFAQIASDALELPLERIRPVGHGSTNLLKGGGGSFSSRSTVMAGSALVEAAKKLKAEICEAAAAKLGCVANDIDIRDGEAIGPGGQKLAFGALAADIPAVDALYTNPKRTYSYGAHAVHVAVDPGTGGIEVLDYVAVEDVGRIINPATLHGQALGAIVQGLGGALLEHLVYDDNGQLLAGSYADYLLPTASDFPSIRVFAMEDKPAPDNPLGAKGAGEGGIISTGGVIANAVANALSSLKVEPRALPLAPPTVWALIEEARD